MINILFCWGLTLFFPGKHYQKIMFYFILWKTSSYSCLHSRIYLSFLQFTITLAQAFMSDFLFPGSAVLMPNQHVEFVSLAVVGVHLWNWTFALKWKCIIAWLRLIMCKNCMGHWCTLLKLKWSHDSEIHAFLSQYMGKVEPWCKACGEGELPSELQDLEDTIHHHQGLYEHITTAYSEVSKLIRTHIM